MKIQYNTYKPLLVFNEDTKRRDMFKGPSLRKYREQIRKADTIVFIYPIWWGIETDGDELVIWKKLS